MTDFSWQVLVYDASETTIICLSDSVSDMVQLRETSQEYGQISRVLLLGETHYSAIDILSCIRKYNNWKLQG